MESVRGATGSILLHLEKMIWKCFLNLRFPIQKEIRKIPTSDRGGDCQGSPPCMCGAWDVVWAQGMFSPFSSHDSKLEPGSCVEKSDTVPSTGVLLAHPLVFYCDWFFWCFNHHWVSKLCHRALRRQFLKIYAFGKQNKTQQHEFVKDPSEKAKLQFWRRRSNALLVSLLTKKLTKKWHGQSNYKRTANIINIDINVEKTIVLAVHSKGICMTSIPNAGERNLGFKRQNWGNT